MEGGIPRPRMTAILIPQSRELRRIPRYTVSAISGERGQFEIEGVIPGDYYLFGVSADDKGEEFAIGFADRHMNEAKSVQVKAKETQTVNVGVMAGGE